MRRQTVPERDYLPTLEAILSRYKGPDDRCRHKIFGDILSLVLWSSAARGLGYFQAYDAKQTLLSGVEHARPGIASARDIANHRRKSRLKMSGKQRRQHNVRARRSFGHRDDDRLSWPWAVLAEGHTAHLQINRQLVLVDGEERQIHAVEIALPYGLCGQIHAGNEHVGLGVSDRRDNMGGGDDEALTQVYPPSRSPRLWRVLPDVDRIKAQRIIAGLRTVNELGMGVAQRHQG
jgi:hypothetical protein